MGLQTVILMLVGVEHFQSYRRVPTSSDSSEPPKQEVFCGTRPTEPVQRKPTTPNRVIRA